jgi:hypothetical protein
MNCKEIESARLYLSRDEWWARMNRGTRMDGWDLGVKAWCGFYCWPKNLLSIQKAKNEWMKKAADVDEECGCEGNSTWEATVSSSKEWKRDELC